MKEPESREVISHQIESRARDIIRSQLASLALDDSYTENQIQEAASLVAKYGRPVSFSSSLSEKTTQRMIEYSAARIARQKMKLAQAVIEIIDSMTQDIDDKEDYQDLVNELKALNKKP